MILPPLTYWWTPHFHIDDLGSNGDHHFQIDNLLTFICWSLSLSYWLAPHKIYYVNSDKDMALALSSDMDDLWIAVLLQSLFLLQYCPLLRVLSIALWQSALGRWGGGREGDTRPMVDEIIPCPSRLGCRCWCSARSESETLDPSKSEIDI